MPWARASRFAGDELQLKAYLKRHGKSPASVSEYQRTIEDGGGVPIQEIGDLVLKAAQGLQPTSPEDDMISNGLMDVLRDLYRKKVNMEDLQHILEALARSPDVPSAVAAWALLLNPKRPKPSGN